MQFFVVEKVFDFGNSTLYPCIIPYTIDLPYSTLRKRLMPCTFVSNVGVNTSVFPFSLNGPLVLICKSLLVGNQCRNFGPSFNC